MGFRQQVRKGVLATAIASGLAPNLPEAAEPPVPPAATALAEPPAAPLASAALAMAEPPIAAVENWEGKGTSLKAVFGDKKYTDQYGQAINLAQQVGNDPAIIVFGYPQCEACANIITPILEQTNRTLRFADKKVPIYVINMLPEGMDTSQNQSYVEYYYKKGIQQFKDNSVSAEADYEKGKERPQNSRLLHIVNGPTDQNSLDIERRLKLLCDPESPYNHSTQLVLFKNGVAEQVYQTANTKSNIPQALLNDLPKTTPRISDIEAASGKGSRR